MRSLADDRGAVRVVTMTRLLVILAIVGILGYDTFAVMSTHVSTENDAQNAAFAASQAWHNNPNIDQAYQAAVTELASNPAEKVQTTGFTIDPDGTAHLIVVRKAKTILFGHIGAMKNWVLATERGDANSVN
jgi:hypothetical protein